LHAKSKDLRCSRSREKALHRACSDDSAQRATPCVCCIPGGRELRRRRRRSRADQEGRIVGPRAGMRTGISE
jgi:hypothetical protein